MGVAAVLFKPVDPGELAAKVTELLADSHSKVRMPGSFR